MLTIVCPHCGARTETEFLHGGHAGVTRPFIEHDVPDPAFATYLFMRTPPVDGVLFERWLHAAGCGQWFTAHRDLHRDTFVRATS